MKFNVHGAYLAVLIPAFGAYLYAESLIRQGAISNIDAKKFNIDTVVSELPGAVRDAVSYRIHYGQLQDSIRFANSDTAKAIAISNLADFVKEPEKRVELYEQVLKRFPTLSESSRAYAFFLNNPSQQGQTTITIPQYHQYIQKFTPLDQYYIWTIGMAKIRQLQANEQVQFAFLQPLLKMNPSFRDYSGLYRQLSELAARLGNKNDYRLSVKLEEACLELPMMEVLLMKEMEKKMAAQKNTSAKKDNAAK